MRLADDFSAKAQLTLEEQEFVKSVDRAIDKLNELGKATSLTDKQLDKVDKQLNQARSSFLGLANNTQKSVKATQQHVAARRDEESSLIRTRYALYDVASTYAAVSAAALAAAGVTAKTAIEYESAFSAVERTTLQASGAVAGNINQIRDSLLQLSTEIPVAFTDLTKIASLGAQLGVPTEDLDKFTETVAKFSATTNVSLEETAKSFGSIGELLDVPISQYENLGSAIALVGVNSVATESEILSVTNGIAAAAQGIGLSAQETVGFAGALSSLRIPTYLSSGFATRFFNDLSIAVAKGGKELQKYADLLGISSEQARNLFQSDPGEFLVQLLKALNASDNLALSLEQLGVNGSNDQRVLSKLAQNVDVLTGAISDANQGFSDGTFLNDAYAKVVEDVASQLQILLNTFNNFLATAGQPMLAFLGASLPLLTQMLQLFTDIAKSPYGQYLAGIGAILLVGIGLFVAYRAAIALSTASLLALNTAQAELAAKFGVTSFTLRGLIGQLLGLTAAENGATASTGRLSASLKTLGKGTGILLAASAVLELYLNTRQLVDLTDDLLGLQDALDDVGTAYVTLNGVSAGVEDGMVKVGNAALELGDILEYLINPIAGLQAVANGAFNIIRPGKALGQIATVGHTAAASITNLGSAAGGAAREVRTLVDYADDLANVFQRATDLRFARQLSMDEVNTSWRELTDRIRDARNELLGLTAQRNIKSYFLSVAEAYGDTLRADELRADIADLNSRIADTQADATTELKGNSKGAIQNRKAITDLLVRYQDYIADLASSGASQNTLNKAVASARTQFLAQAQALGFSNAQLKPYIASFNDLTYAISRVPRNLTVGANVNPAIQAIQEFLAKANKGGYGGGSIPVTIKPNDPKKDGEDAGRKFREGFARGLNTTNGKLGISINSGSGGGGWAGGGFTGTGGKYQPAGTVHKGEYVFPKSQVNQRTGLPYADAFGAVATGSRGRTGYADGGFVNPGRSSGYNEVRLDPYSLKRLAGMGTVILDGQVLARSVNRVNGQNATRGG